MGMIMQMHVFRRHSKLNLPQAAKVEKSCFEIQKTGQSPVSQLIAMLIFVLFNLLFSDNMFNDFTAALKNGAHTWSELFSLFNQ